MPILGRVSGKGGVDVPGEVVVFRQVSSPITVPLMLSDSGKTVQTKVTELILLPPNVDMPTQSPTVREKLITVVLVGVSNNYLRVTY